jgi:hypothetical protein
MCRRNARNTKQELFVGVARQLRFRIEALSPGFLEDARAGTGFGFVEAIYSTEIDLVVEEILECRSGVIGVVVVVVVVMAVVYWFLAVIMIVGVRVRHC